jgi:hypothetical protein
MREINWDQFKVKNDNRTSAFEGLCYHLFCRRYKLEKAPKADFNQAGLETEPVLVDGKYYGFQAKFFDHTTGFSQIKKSVKTAIDKFKGELDVIIIYLNTNAKTSSKEYKNIEKFANEYQKAKIKIEWLANSQFNFELLKTANLDLRQIYFDDSYELRFLDKQVDKEKSTFLQSDQYLDLPIEDKYEKQCTDLLSVIKNEQSRQFLIAGNPGSGKSILMYRLFWQLAGLDQRHEERKIEDDKTPLDAILDYFVNIAPVTKLMKLKNEFLKLENKIYSEPTKKNKKQKIKKNKTTIDTAIDATLNYLMKQGAIPMLINLKNCATNNLEDIIRERQDDSKVRGRKLGFIYLFDGLDELSEENCDNVLSWIEELSKSENAKIIFSCRSSNPNRYKTTTYFKNILEYKIANLDESHINKFFEAKEPSKTNEESSEQKKNGEKSLEEKKELTKKEKLENLKTNNPKIVEEIKDILLISLLWDTLDELTASSSIIDLFDKKIHLILDTPHHRKNIESLNLPNPKKDAIITLNQEFSFEFQKEFKFLFKQEELQNIILEQFPRIDYSSANEILKYSASLFFDHSYSSDSSQQQGYIYQHRRYQEYFFAQKLKTEYEKNPKVIRDLGVIANREFFEKIFLNYLRREYVKEANLGGLTEINLIRAYLGGHPGFGHDDACYKTSSPTSSSFVAALASQDGLVLEELLSSDSLEIKDKLMLDFQELKRHFKIWEKDKNAYRSKDYLKNTWGEASSLIESVATFWKREKYELGNEIKRHLDDVLSFYEQDELKEIKKESQRDYPVEDKIYIRLQKESADSFFKNVVRESYSSLSSETNAWHKVSDREKRLSSFFRACLISKKDELFALIKDFDEWEFLIFLDTLKSAENLPVLMDAKSIHTPIKSFLKKFNKTLISKNSHILFFMKFFDLSLSDEEIKFAEKELGRLQNEHPHKWQENYHNLALLAYALEKFTFEESKNHTYYNEISLYSSLLVDFVKMLRGIKTTNSVIRDYNYYMRKNTYNLGRQKGAEFAAANLLALILKFDKSDISVKNNLKNILCKNLSEKGLKIFYSRLNYLDQDLFSKLINESDLAFYKAETQKYTGVFHEHSEKCFDLASLLSQLNPEEAKYYISKGVNDGTLRHLSRKDSIVAHDLIEALEMLWKNNWESAEKLKEYTKEVFDLTIKIESLSEKGTKWASFNLIDIVANYNLELAEQLGSRLKDEYRGIAWSNNKITSSILLAKARLGFLVTEIEEGIKYYRLEHSYNGEPEPDIYEQKFKVYMAVSGNDLYDDGEKKLAFDNAYKQIEDMNKKGIKNYLKDDFEDEKKLFSELCKKYNKNNIISNQNSGNSTKSENKPKITEKEFLEEVAAAKGCLEIKALYNKLQNIDNIDFISKNSWEKLLEKTYEICKNTGLFIKLLKNKPYYKPSLEYALAAALNIASTKKEIIQYLSDTKTPEISSQLDGHGGFIQLLKAYEINNDKKSYLKLFERFLKMCHLLVD